MIDILYEDPYIYVCFKPAGMPVQSGRGLKRDMLSYLLEKRALAHEELYAHVFTRLDEPVSGLCLVGKDPRYVGLWDKTPITKTYEAIVTGELEAGHRILKAYIRHDKKNNISVVTDDKVPDSKEAILEYDTVERLVVDSVPCTRIRVRLVTGRHHQIRAMFAHIGHPLFADRKYGVSVPLRSVALCAVRLEFRHPVTHKDIDIRTEWKYYEE